MSHAIAIARPRRSSCHHSAAAAAIAVFAAACYKVVLRDEELS
jgi:hypothetical protein